MADGAGEGGTSNSSLGRRGGHEPDPVPNPPVSLRPVPTGDSSARESPTTSPLLEDVSPREGARDGVCTSLFGKQTKTKRRKPVQGRSVPGGL